MLTSFQCDTVAYIGDGFVVCPDCAAKRAADIAGVEIEDAPRTELHGLFLHLYGVIDPEVSGLEPVIRYSAEESWPEGLGCEDCSTTIVEPDPDTCTYHGSSRRWRRSGVESRVCENVERLEDARDCKWRPEPPALALDGMIAMGERLAAQNNGAAWIDCTLRRNPRGHRFVIDGKTDTSISWQCRRCKVGTLTAKGADIAAPNPWLRRGSA